MKTDFDPQLARLYGIDGGELNDVSREQAFVLGVEYANISSSLFVAMEGGSRLDRVIHSDNAARVRELLRGTHAPKHRFYPIDEDWYQLEVDPLEVES